MGRLALRLLLSLSGVAIVTYTAYSVIPHNPTSVGFAYLLLVLIIASTWGIVEATLASLAATLTFNFFFLPPVGKFTIADPQNWVALFSFLATALITSRLSARVKKQALDAVDRQRDIERLYTFSRAILLIDPVEPLAKQLARKLAEVFGLRAVVLYDRRTGEIHRAGPSDFDGIEDQLRDAASQGTSFFDPEHQRVITAVRLGSEPIASFAIQGRLHARLGLAGHQQSHRHRPGAGPRAEPGPSGGSGAPQRATAYHAHRCHGARIQDAAHLHPRRHHVAVIAARSAHGEPYRAAWRSPTRKRGICRRSLTTRWTWRAWRADHIQVRRELTDPKELVEDVLASLRTQIDQRPVEIQAEGSVASALARSPVAQAGPQAGARQCPEVFAAALSCHGARVQQPFIQWRRRYQV